MPILLDATVLYSALAKDGWTRFILLNMNERFVAPIFVLQEICEHKDEICTRSKIAPKDFDMTLTRILKRVRLKEPGVQHYSRAVQIMQKTDSNDVPYVALASYLKGTETSFVIIWSNDLHFKTRSVQTSLKQFCCIVMNTSELKERKFY